MDQTNILLANYPSIYQRFILEEVFGENRLNVVTGYDITYDKIVVRNQIASDFLTALLTYDKVIILASNFDDVCKVIGFENIKELLRLHILQIIPDLNLNPVLLKNDSKYQLDFIGFPNGYDDEITHKMVCFDHPLGHIESWLSKIGVDKSERNVLITLLEDNELQVEEQTIKGLAIEESKLDMQNIEFLTDKDFYRVNNGIVEMNLTNQLRLHKLNTLSVIASKLNVNGLKADGAISELLFRKTKSALSSSLHDGLDAMQSIVSKKGFPELGELYVKGIISMADILRLRETFQNKMFRFWLKMDNYEEEVMTRDVMNSVHNVFGNKISNLIRMTVCSVAGIKGFIPGVAASAFDSFVLNKVANGWHPNFFLDDKLKEMIDTKIKEQSRLQRINEIRERFGDVGRNDPCPCGSGKKFKKCHGIEM